ncbi:MAG TPA: hypothetical protein PKL77_07215 [Candidatus Omnitrophota bacterium]|nr:hypothetical protein [Candidatus Omnitrophota bacterium]
MFGNAQMYAALNVTEITNTIDVKSKGDTAKALFNALIVPTVYSFGGSSVKITAEKTINFYRIAPISTGSEVQRIVFQVNCRAPLLSQAETIGYAVFTQLHRRTYSGYFIRCKVLAPIPPADNTDTYNQPVECEMILKPEA